MRNKAIAIHGFDASIPLPNLQQEAFVQAYTGGEFFGRAIEAYLQTYRIDRSKRNYRTIASNAASRLLANAIVCKRINFLLQTECGFNNESVDRQLSFLIEQHGDLRSKLGAIKEYNQLKGRITRKLDIQFTDTSDEQLAQELETIEAEIKKTDDLARAVRSEREKTIAGLPDLTDAQREQLREGKLLPT